LGTNFPKQESNILKKASEGRKGKIKETHNRQRQKEIQEIYRLMPGAGLGCSTAGGFGVLMPLPLPGGIVTAAISHMTMRARRRLGGGWATKNARCGKQGSKEAW